jgi:polyether ionophore transport system permease protein
MTAPGVLVPSATRQKGDGRSTDLTVTRRAFKQVWISAVVWSVVFGGTAAASAVSYVRSFPDMASRLQIAASTGKDRGLAILLGPVAAIDTVGGYTAYKCFVFLTTIGAIWGLLAATRLLRGEEDSGRWQVVLAGGTTATRATLATLLALAGAVGILLAGTSLLVLLAGRDPDVRFTASESFFYGLSIAIAPAVFAGVGALTSQLSRSRRLATGIAMYVFAVAFIVRMIADSGPGTKWLLWFTPFGWTERMRPFTDPDPRPLVVAVVAVIALVMAATSLAGRRDAGAGAWTTHDVGAPRSFGLRSPLGLAVRLELPLLIAWWVGAAMAGLSLGIIAKVATGSIPESFRDALDNFGVQGSFLKQYFGVAFLLVAAVVGLLPASQIGAAADEETSGRLVHLLARPARRANLLLGRLALATAAVVIAGLLAGLGSWLGVKSQGVDPGFGAMVVAGLNVVPTALLVLGIGAVVLALVPSASAPTIYAVVTASLIIDLLASMVSSFAWLDHLSLFRYMALAPAQDPDSTTIATTLLLTGTLYVAATLLFRRRDLQTG